MFVQRHDRICANPSCNNQIINRRSDAHSCSVKCSIKVKCLREKAKGKDRSEYRKKYYKENKEKINLKEKKYREANKEKIALRVKLQRIRDAEQYKKRTAKYRDNNRDKLRQTAKEYRERNKELCYQRIKDWEKKNKGKRKSYKAKHRALQIKATPVFADMEKIHEIYKNCPKGFHVDHIIPLNNPIVCGLHVEWNLQYLSAKENCSKGNKLL
jgi:hypothetical protein